MLPKLIHRYWMGDRRPSYVDDFEQAWITSHPDWSIRTWSDDELAAEDLAWLDLYSRLAPKRDSARHRSNMIRYRLLLRDGGVWADCDVRPLRNLEEVLDDRAFVATLAGHAEGGVMGGPVGHSLFADLVDGFKHRPPKASSVEASGMEYLQAVLERHPEVRRCPPSMFFTYNASGKAILGKSYTEHLWASSGLKSELERREKERQ